MDSYIRYEKILHQDTFDLVYGIQIMLKTAEKAIKRKSTSFGKRGGFCVVSNSNCYRFRNDILSVFGRASS